MKVLLLLAAMIMAFGSILVQGALLEFGKMIKSETGMSGYIFYGFYGCHCGLGGTGVPKDATDWCCVTHDCCYDRLENYGCGTKLLTYKINEGDRISCSANQDLCQRMLCQCDKEAAECFARNKKSYSFKYAWLFGKDCEGKTPSCSEAASRREHHI